MQTAFYLAIALLLVVAVYPVFHVVVVAFLKLRGRKTVTCPETRQACVIEVNASHAAAMVLLGTESLRLQKCSLWPERRNCGQACVKQLGGVAPTGVII
jgi:hypothetical protein